MLLNQQGFDLWADGYDQTVQLSEENQQYPFAGYKDILNKIFNEVMQVPASTVLDSNSHHLRRKIKTIDHVPMVIKLSC